MVTFDQLNLFESPRILIVDDEKVIREILADFLSIEGFSVETASDGIAALEQLNQAHFDMVISDLKMPNMGGLELLAKIQNHHDNILTVIMTGFGTVETAIEAMKNGAYDYILKPFKVEEVVHIVYRGLEKQRLISENIRLKEIISLHSLSEQLQATLSLDEVIESTLKHCVEYVSCSLVAMYRYNDEFMQFEKSGHMVNDDAPPGSDMGVIDFNTVEKEIEKTGFVLVHGEAMAPFFFEIPKDLASFMCIPLVVRQKNIGLLAFYSFTSDARFAKGQRKLVSILASRAAAAIDNAKLYRDLQRTFRQTIQGLARTIEAMDKYTAGHSDRVTVYARLMAEGMGEPPEKVELITQSAMLHDIGKLGCHANLNKPEKLTSEEYEIFKAHPSFGKDILDPISFLHPLIPGVHMHHERWDGKGYPLGLSGESIPKIARVLAVADSYDAMTSSRAYRRALEHSVAMSEITRCSGTQFDPAVVEAFIKVIERYRRDCKRLGIQFPR